MGKDVTKERKGEDDGGRRSGKTEGEGGIRQCAPRMQGG